MKAMFYYELSSIKQNPLNVVVILFIPAIAVLLLKLFFDSALLFGYTDTYSQKLNKQYFNFSVLEHQNATFINYAPRAYGRIISTMMEDIAVDYRRMQERRQISQKYDYDVQKMMNLVEGHDDIDNVREQAVYRAFQQYFQSESAANNMENIQRQLNISNGQVEYLRRLILAEFAVPEEELAKEYKSSLFSIQFDVQESNGTLTYTVYYNTTLLDELNQLRNESRWNLFDYYQRYQNALGIQLQQYLEAALLKELGIEDGAKYEVFPYPNKQLSVNDPSQMDHGIACLCIIILYICTMFYLGRDRGRQQSAMRLLGLEEFYYIFVRMCFTTFMAAIGGTLMCITAQQVGLLPFSACNAVVNIISGVFIGGLISGQLMFVSTLFGQNGVITPIIVVLLVLVATNFIIELIIYVIYGSYSLKDPTIVGVGVFYVLSALFPNVNLYNFIDVIRYNVRNTAQGDLCGINAYHTVVNVPCAKIEVTSGQVDTYTYDMLNIVAVIIMQLISNIIYTALATIISYTKPERGHPSVNPFLLQRARRRIRRVQDDNICEIHNANITYGRACGKRVTAISDFDLSFGQMQAGGAQQLKLGLLGVSSAGKTSILSMLSGQIKITRRKGTEQKAVVMQHNIFNKEERYLLRKRVSVCPQSNENIISDLSLFQNVYLAHLLGGQQGASIHKTSVKALLSDFQLEEHMHKKVCQLSGGMQRRLSICNCFISCIRGEEDAEISKLLVLDEISSGLDPFTCRLIDNKLQEICQNNPKVHFILSTHDMKQVQKVCSHIVMMEKGQVKLNNTVLNIQLSQDNKYFYTIVFNAGAAEFGCEQLLAELQNTYGEQQYSILVKTQRIVKLKLLDDAIVADLYARFKDRVYRIQVDKGNLTDIFLDQIHGNDVQEDDGGLVNEIDRPSAGKSYSKQLRGLYGLYFFQDLQSSCVRVPFTVLFLLLVPLVTFVSMYINNVMVGFVNGKIDTAKMAAYKMTADNCLNCCNMQTFDNIEQQAAECLRNTTCFTSSGRNYHAQGDCFNMLRLLQLPVIYNGYYKINDVDSNSDYYSGYQNNRYVYLVQGDAAGVSPFAATLSPDDDRFMCYQCASMCVLECRKYKEVSECAHDCYAYIQFNDSDNSLLVENKTLEDYFVNSTYGTMQLTSGTSCHGICQRMTARQNYRFTSVAPNEFTAFMQNISQYQNNRRMLEGHDILLNLYTNQMRHELTNHVIPQALISNTKDMTSIYTFFPSARGGFLTYEEYKSKFPTREQFNTQYLGQLSRHASNIYHTQRKFDLNLDKYYNESQLVLQDLKVIDVPYDQYTEIYNSVNLGVQTKLFDNVNFIINHLNNQKLRQRPLPNKVRSLRQLPQDVMALGTVIQNVSAIQAQAQPYPLFTEWYESSSFSMYLQLIQVIIICIALNLPLIQSAITFTTLSSSNFIKLMNIHGFSNMKIYGNFLFYSLIYQVPGVLLCALVSWLVGVEQFSQQPIMYVLYCISVTFSSTITGILVSRLCADKKHAIFVCCILIIVILFISLFQTKSSFLLVLIPQLYSIHQLLYLPHIDKLEWLNIIVTVLVSLVYFLVAVKPQSLTFEINENMNPNNYIFVDDDDTRQVMQINYENSSRGQEPEIAADNRQYDIVVDKICTSIQNTRILSDISFKIGLNNSFGLLGLSGSGKSVTLQTLLRQVRQTSGNIYIRSLETDKLVDIAVMPGNVISYVPQQDILVEHMTVRQHIQVFTSLHQHSSTKYAMQLCRLLKLTDHFGKRVNQLSGGTKRRLSFLLALIQSQSNIIAFDETSTGLSPDLKIVLWDIITMIQSKLQKSCIITTHYMDEIQALVQDLVILKDGRIYVHAMTNDLIYSRQISKIVRRDSVKSMYTNQVIGFITSQSPQDEFYIENTDIQDVFLAIYDSLQIQNECE